MTSEGRPSPATSSLEDTRRDLALLASDMVGAQSYAGQLDSIAPIRLGRSERRDLRNQIETTQQAVMVIDPRPGLHLLDVNEAYAIATLTSRYIAGDKLFDVFPDNPDAPGADGVSNLYDSIHRAVQTGAQHAMAIQRYDVRDAQGLFVVRHWRCTNTPVFDDEGRLRYVLHHAAEVSAAEALARPRLNYPPSGAADYGRPPSAE